MFRNKLKKIRKTLFCSQTHDFVLGTAVQYTDQISIKYEITGELIPHKSIPHSISKVLSQMYNELGLDDQDKKYVANLFS